MEKEYDFSEVPLEVLVTLLRDRYRDEDNCLEDFDPAAIRSAVEEACDREDFTRPSEGQPLRKQVKVVLDNYESVLEDYGRVTRSYAAVQGGQEVGKADLLAFRSGVFWGAGVVFAGAVACLTWKGLEAYGAHNESAPTCDELEAMHRSGRRKQSRLVLPIQDFGPALLRVDASYHKLTTVPPEILAAAHLQRLELARNELVELPAALGELKSLRLLDVRSNLLQVLPSSLAAVEPLSCLLVSDNPLVKHRSAQTLLLLELCLVRRQCSDEDLLLLREQELKVLPLTLDLSVTMLLRQAVQDLSMPRLAGFLDSMATEPASGQWEEEGIPQSPNIE